jgi:hypothetical protein
MTILLAATGDEHGNCRAGLCVAPVALDEGGTFYPSATQRAIAVAWGHFWDGVEERAEKAGATEVWWVNCGDAADLNKHDGLSPITSNRARILDQLAKLYQRPAGLSSRRFIVKGTEAHVGPHCELESMLGRMLEAEPDPDTGDYAWWALSLECEGVTFDIAHHPRGGGSLAWTRNNAAMRTALDVSIAATDRGERVPAIAIRGHVHYFADSGTAREPRCFFLDGWQGLNPYAYRRGYTVPSPVGGMVFVCRDGHYEAERLWWKPRKAKTWKAS